MKFDICIIGAGLVGQALAAALVKGEQGQNERAPRIALIDPAPLNDPELASDIHDYDLRVSALTAKSQAFLTRIGAWEKMPASCPKAYNKMHVWDAEGTGAVTFDAADLQASCLGHIVENRHTNWALRELVNESSHIDLIATQLTSFDNPNEQGYTPLKLANGLEIQTRLLVGADGALSRVRQSAGIQTREWDYQHQAIVASVECEQPIAATAWQRFRPEGPLAFLPLHTNEHMASIVWSTSQEEAEHLLSLDDEGFKQALGQAFEFRLGAIKQVSQRQSYPLRQRHAKRYFDNGVVLVGDAAHTIHPLAGQGVNLGFKDADVLAQELLRAFNKGLALNHDSVLARYQRRRQGDNLATMAAMEGFKRLFGADEPIVRLVRNQGMKWFDRILPLKQHTMMKAMGID